MSDENQPPPEQQKDREGAAQDKALDKLTDRVEEKQLDQKKVQKAMRDLLASQRADREAQRLREKELAAVKVNSEHVDIIAHEFELDRKAAERRLRECNGNLVQALESYLSQ